jgi:hypothetical protein
VGFPAKSNAGIEDRIDKAMRKAASFEVRITMARAPLRRVSLTTLEKMEWMNFERA